MNHVQTLFKFEKSFQLRFSFPVQRILTKPISLSRLFLGLFDNSKLSNRYKIDVKMKLMSFKVFT